MKRGAVDNGWKVLGVMRDMLFWNILLLQLDERNVNKLRFANSAVSRGKNRTHSYLELRITNNLFQNGQLQVRCLASIGDIYRAAATVNVTEDAPLIASITGDASPQNDCESWNLWGKI